MSQDKIETYFAKKGINVIFNTLGHTKELTHSFVSDYRHIVDRSPRKQSQHVKISTYSDMYSFEVRPKLTGFEKYKEKDQAFRKAMEKLVNDPQYSPSLQIDNIDLDKTKSYKTLLSDSLEKIENPLLYLSGGLDSELVAYAFLEKNIKFKIVVFEYVDDKGNIANMNDITYAYRFCKRNGLIPEIYQINIDKLWDSEHFKKLALEIQYVSPHLVTYAHMVELMSIKHPGATHLFGGEIKFFTNYQTDNGELANIVLLNKVTPSYSGQLIGTATNCTGILVSCYYFSDGNWAIIASEDFNQVQDQTLASGVWYSNNPPPFNYMIRVSSVLTAYANGAGSYAIPDSPSAFQNISPTVVVASVYAAGTGFGGGTNAYLECTTELREVGQTFAGLFAQLYIAAGSSCF